MNPHEKFQVHELWTEQFEERPKNTVVDTLIIHSMHNPESKDKFSAASCKACLDKYGVSTHYIIDLNGKVWITVKEEKRAWHAGTSKMPDPNDGREAVNDFSIGVELVGTEDTNFTEAQYQALTQLTKDIMSRHNINNIYGHSDIAPERKTDPWGLDWVRYRQNVLQCSNKQNSLFCDAAFG
ncbi:N-acetylmuramoyl-L-alanine amidase [Candidatus Parabeggiatoa sp. HSG14]|uniref:N-acetylmuramoyl-L-alanine amidase n=1 Tax=Candidatus Parabeggiatoa sp. HSG14 TaxID=3055593 RepID=UPI0025A8A1B5|nr:N-acetylmuramoyl-L-alanine amidase [Thiotrichales bacterium HSG14]